MGGFQRNFVLKGPALKVLHLFSLFFFSLLFWFGVFLLSLSPSLFVFLFILVYFSLLVLF